MEGVGNRRRAERNPERIMVRGRAGCGEPMRAVAVLAELIAILLMGAAVVSRPASVGEVGREGGGVTVINVPPQFSGFRVRAQDGLNYVDVVISDYNSWADIFRVEVAIENDRQAPVADVAFQQYPDNVTLQRQLQFTEPVGSLDRKSTRLNSSHSSISYAVFCLKKKKRIEEIFRLSRIETNAVLSD